MKIFKFLYFIVAICLFACTSNKDINTTASNYKLNQPLSLMAPYDEGYPLTDSSIDPNEAFKDKDYVEYYKDIYKDKTTPPPFNFNVKLTNKSFNELRMLRAEILARHGFFFMDYVLRSHFQATKWYKPVFWYNNFKIKLSDEEKQFITKVLKQEQKLYAKNYIQEGDVKKANWNNIVNLEQYSSIPNQVKTHLQNDGFVITKGEYEQLFHIYDENYYDYTPSFITTDLLLQVIHMHISKEMQLIEQEKMIQILTSLLTEQYSIAKSTNEISKNLDIKKAASWMQTYYAVGLSLLTGKTLTVPSYYSKIYEYELNHTQMGEGQLSFLNGDSLYDYTQFQPRGNYTRNDSLKRYFKCVKWLNSTAIYLDNKTQFEAAILSCYSLLNSPISRKNYQIFSNIISFLAGDENNLSFAHLSKILSTMKCSKVEELLTDNNLEKIKIGLIASNPQIMHARGVNERTTKFIEQPKIRFTAGRYTFDAEILQRLIHITAPQPKRPFPKSLDIFAVMGNKTAENILLKTYNEPKNWNNYTDTLSVLKQKLLNFSAWDKSIYNKTMETILSMQKTQNANLPYFMKRPNWQKKNLNTMLASWTGLKHDMILYIEQPSGAEMGDGGEIPPPQKIAYVEPQVECWKKCLELLSLNESMLKNNGLYVKQLEYRNNELKQIAELLLKVSEKELNGQKVTNDEFDELSFLGGRIESLTLNIIDSYETEITMVKSPDKCLAIAADVYTFNQLCLEETVGLADNIYVVAEINGLLYITRGAVFSQYEFVQSTSNRLTDETWQKQLQDKKEPKQHIWLDDIRINAPKLITAPNFNLY